MPSVSDRNGLLSSYLRCLSWSPGMRRGLALGIYTVLPHISQMSYLALACNLRHTLQDKGFDAFYAKVTGEPNG